MLYHPQGEGIRLIQKYVRTVPKKKSCHNRSTHEGDIYKYDFVGAVGLQRSSAGRATIVYHMYWTGFGPKDMTWEPECHLFAGDLEALWSKYGRANTAGKIYTKPGGNETQVQSDLFDDGDFDLRDTDHVKPPTSVDNTDIGRETDPRQISIGCSGVPSASKAPEPSAGYMEGRLERDAGNLHERRSSCDQIASQTTTTISLEPDRLDIDFLRETYQRNSPNTPDLGETNGNTLSDPVSETIRSPNGNPEINVVDSCSTQLHDEIVPNKSKRKRRFCKRTKTGSLSCCERKKKCDGQRPSCESYRICMHST